MLKVYIATWCPHCNAALQYLTEIKIPFEAIDLEQQPPDIVQKVIDVNGGLDWVVPTLEYNGQWREGKVFNPQGLNADLIKLGAIG